MAQGVIAQRPTYNAGDYTDSTLTISSPGTTSGIAYRQTVNGTGIITITTAGPVIIEDCKFAARGIVINCSVSNADVTIRNCQFFGLNRDTSSQTAQKVITILNAKNIVIENNYFEYWWGIDIRTFQGNGTAGQRIYIRYNDMHQGQQFGTSLSHWIIWNFTSTCSNSEIAWNRFTGTYADGGCEDTINMFGCAGTAGNKILIHDNLFDGANTTSGASSSAFNIQMESADYVDAYNNICVGGVGGGITAYGGNPTNINFHDNRVVQTGWRPGTSTFMTAERINAHGLMLSGYAAGYMTGCTHALTMNDNWSISQRNVTPGGARSMSNYANWAEGWAACIDQGGNLGQSITSLTAAQALALEDAEVALWESRVTDEVDLIVGVESLVEAPPDTTAPVLTNQSVESITYTGGTPQVDTDEGNGILYMVVVANGDSPSATQIQNGQNSGGTTAIVAQEIAITGTGTIIFDTFAGAGIAASTAYDCWFCHVDSNANVSTPVKADFTTSAAPAGQPSATAGGFGGIA